MSFALLKMTYLLEREDKGWSKIVAILIERGKDIIILRTTGELLRWRNRGEIYLHEGGILWLQSFQKKHVILTLENHLRASILFLLCH